MFSFGTFKILFSVFNHFAEALSDIKILQQNSNSQSVRVIFENPTLKLNFSSAVPSPPKCVTKFLY